MQQLSGQLSELKLRPDTKVAAQQQALTEAQSRLAEMQRLLEEERVRRQQQVASLRYVFTLGLGETVCLSLIPFIQFRKELNMALIAEKEASIALLQTPGESLKQKIERLVWQKERLKHELLLVQQDTITADRFGPFFNTLISSKILAPFSATSGPAPVPVVPSSSTHFQQQQMIYHPAAEGSRMVLQSLQEPIRVQTFGQHYVGPISAGMLSAPASLSYLVGYFIYWRGSYPILLPHIICRRSTMMTRAFGPEA